MYVDELEEALREDVSKETKEKILSNTDIYEALQLLFNDNYYGRILGADLIKKLDIMLRSGNSIVSYSVADTMDNIRVKIDIKDIYGQKYTFTLFK